MPALPPRLSSNPSPQEIDQYREKLQEYAQSLEEQQQEQDKRDKDQDQKEKELKAREDKDDLEQARLEKWRISLDEERVTFDLQREKYGAEKEKLEIEIHKLKEVNKESDSQRELLEKWETQLRVEEARIEVLKTETKGYKGKEALDPAIILQQKELLEKCFNQNKTTTDLVARQIKLEEKREQREKEREKKEEEKEKLKLATGKGFKPPSFKGVQGERPEAHILRAEDWMDASNPNMDEAQKVKNFRLTLDHHAREWYDKADSKTTWKALKLGFSRYFSTQGRSVKNLHERWKMFKFNPQTDDIEEFVRDVQETATQLKYDEEAVSNVIKTCMPMDMYTSLYEITDLEKIITKVRDIYARPVVKGADSATAAPSAVPSATPFCAMQGISAEQYMFLQAQGGDNKQKPFKPYVTPQGRGRARGRGRGGRGRGRGRGGSGSQENRFTGRGQFSFRGSWQPRGSRGRGQRFDKSPNVKKPRVNAKTPNQDKDRCLKCKEFGHWARDCPQNNNNAQGDNGAPAQQKTFPGVNYNYMYPMVPQVPMAPVAMPSNAVQMPIQPHNTAAMGQIQDVMMQMKEVGINDNPLFMEITEVMEGEESAYLN